MTITEYPLPRAEGCPFDPPPGLTKPFSRVRLWDGSTPWLVTRYDDQRALLADKRVSSDVRRPGFPSQGPRSTAQEVSFILMDDPDHQRLRRMVTAPFTNRRIEKLRPAVQKIVDDLIDSLLTGPGTVDLVEAFALPVPSLVICDLLGVPYADHDFFQENSRTIIRRTTTADERLAAQSRLTDYLEKLLTTKQPGDDDVLADLNERVKAGDLDRREAARMGVLLLIAGHETTANMIALGTLALLENPRELRRLQRGTDVKLAVEEMLRYLTITHQGRRRLALEDIEIGGVTIKAGEGIILTTETGNRDPAVFEAGDELDLTRDAHGHVAFGFGVHQCLGQPLARLELQVVYGTLYRRIPTLELAVPIEEIRFKHDGFVYGVYELPVRWS